MDETTDHYYVADLHTHILISQHCLSPRRTSRTRDTNETPIPTPTPTGTSQSLADMWSSHPATARLPFQSKPPPEPTALLHAHSSSTPHSQKDCSKQGHKEDPCPKTHATWDSTKPKTSVPPCQSSISLQVCTSTCIQGDCLLHFPSQELCLSHRGPVCSNQRQGIACLLGSLL